MRNRVQGPSPAKQKRELTFRETVSREEPVGNQRGTEESAAEAVDAEQQRKAGDRVSRPLLAIPITRGAIRKGSCQWWRRHLDARRQHRIRRDRCQRRGCAHEEDRTMRAGERERGEATERVA